MRRRKYSAACAVVKARAGFSPEAGVKSEQIARIKKPPDGGFFVVAGAKRSVASVLAATGAGFMYADAGQLRQQRLEFQPDPLGEILAGGVFQAGDIVQVVVVEALVDRFEDCLDLGKVADPAGVRVDLTLDVDGRTEGVTMQAAAFVASRHVRQEMGGFEGEFFEQFQGKRSAG